MSGYSLFVYLSWVFVIIVWIFLYRTPYGFWIRASGEHPSALETAGIDPVKMKFLASVLCGIFCGLAGAHLALGYLNCFTEGMSASRGFIAFVQRTAADVVNVIFISVTEYVYHGIRVLLLKKRKLG